MLTRLLPAIAAILPSSLKYRMSRLKPWYTAAMSWSRSVTTVKTQAGLIYWHVDRLTSQKHLRGTYEPYMQEAFRQYVRRGAVVYDVGAHAGFHTLFCGLLVGAAGRVIAFEPNRDNRVSLERQCSLNGTLPISVLPFALADRSGMMAFDSSAGSAQGRLSAGGATLVEAKTLDSLVGEGTIPAPSVIKVDAEGGEEQVLRGAIEVLKRYRPVILCDVNDNTTGTVMQRVLCPLGYDIVKDWPLTAVPRG